MLEYKKNFIAKIPYKSGRITLRHVSEADTMKLMFVRDKEDREAEYTPLPLEKKEENANRRFDFLANTEKYSAIIFSEDRMQIGIYLDFDLIGEIHVFGYNERNKSLEFGYYMLPEYRSMGYGYEGLSAVLQLLLESEDIHKLYARTGEFNKASVALLEKCGLKLEGKLVDCHELNGTYYDELSYYILENK